MTSDPPRTAVGVELSVPAHALRYEELRTYATEYHSPASRNGLVVLLRQGVAAWIDAWSRLPTPPPRPVHQKLRRSSPVPDEASAQVIHVLAAMTLGHLREVCA